MLYSVKSKSELIMHSIRLMHSILSCEKIVVYYKDKEGFRKSTGSVEIIPKLKGIVGEVIVGGEFDFTYNSHRDSRFNPLFDIDTSNALITVPVKEENKAAVAVVQIDYRITLVKGLNATFESIDPVDKSLLEIFAKNMALSLEAVDY